MDNGNFKNQPAPNATGIFKLVIENIETSWHLQYITGKEIRKLANLASTDEIFLAVIEPWNDQLITDSEKVNLGRSDIEHFYVKRALKLTINKKKFEWGREFIYGRQIKQLGGVSHTDQLFLEVPKPGEDELIADDARLNLALPGIENFYSAEVDREVTIVVNGTPHDWEKKKISFEEVVIIAYGKYIDLPTMVYTVAYEDGPKENPEGSMLKGDHVFIKNKMIFHATESDKS